jgi:hypothetical protein
MTDGCGHEYGLITVSGSVGYTSMGVDVSVGSSGVSVNYIPSGGLATSTITGNYPACGAIFFQVYAGNAQGSACTPS